MIEAARARGWSSQDDNESDASLLLEYALNELLGVTNNGATDHLSTVSTKVSTMRPPKIKDRALLKLIDAQKMSQSD